MATLFSFGYWGWGNSVPRLVEAVDAAEHARGFKPPLWVDIRRSRNVRAIGFAGDNFAVVVGHERYRWMPELGNPAYRTPGTIGVAVPAAVVNLLRYGLDGAPNRQRVIFFCACAFPCESGETCCHRRLVAELLVREARASGAAIQVVEWPGLPPASLECEITPRLLRAIARGRKSLPFGALRPPPPHVLTWGSVVRLWSHDAGDLVAIAGAPKYGKEWVLPLIHVVEGGQPLDRAQEWSRSFRSERGLVPLFSKREPGQLEHS